MAILDIQIEGDMNGHELGMQLRRLRPELGIVLLSNFLEFAFVNALRRRRMSGWSYLLKDSVTDVATLQRAVKGTANGEIVLDPRITAHLQARKESCVAELTDREREILGLIAEGYNNRAIAEKVKITVKSVENTINRIFHKMGIESGDGDLQPRVAAVLTYLRETRSAVNGMCLGRTDHGRLGGFVQMTIFSFPEHGRGRGMDDVVLRLTPPTRDKLKEQPFLNPDQVELLASRMVGHPGRTVTDPAVLPKPLSEIRSTFIASEGGFPAPANRPWWHR